MTGFAAKRPRAKPRRGRCFAVFGPPGAGTTTIIKCLLDCTEADCATVFGLSGDALVEGVAMAQKAAEVVFIDGIADADDIQLLATGGCIDASNDGAVIQVHATVAMLEDERLKFSALRTAIELHINTYSVPYYTIYNERDRLVTPILDLARRAHLRK